MVVHLIIKSIVMGVMVLVMQTGMAKAELYVDLMSEVLANDEVYRAAQADAEAAKQTAKSAWGGFYPNLDTTLTYGHERQLKPDAADTSKVSRELDFILTQRIWDFGATNSAIDTAELQHEQTNAVVDATRSQLIVRTFTVFVNVIRASKNLEFADQSVDNIKKQTELEDGLVRSGAGLTTDKLQALRALAGAMARRVQADGALKVATNAYRSFFKKEAINITDMVQPAVSLDNMPDTVDDAVQRAMKNNLTLVSSNFDQLVAREAVKQTFASSFRPTIDGIVDYKIKEDVSATAGLQEEMFAKIQINFPFNLGMTARNTLKATELAENASTLRYASGKLQVEERTRNAWQQLKTARDRSVLLKNQARIAEEFLKLARKERQLGNRSLLDVLAGEVELINANSDALSSETDIVIAAVNLLDNMGELDEGDFQ